MPFHAPIGIDDFRTLREAGLAYVDKSYLIRELIDQPGVQALLLPRPRRFGKSLNLSMLRCFFERQEQSLEHLFADLSIWQAGEPYRGHFQRYPVIHLTWKDVKHDSWDGCWASLRKTIQLIFERHQYLLDSAELTPRQARDYQAILDDTAGPAIYERALLELSMLLHRYHGEKVVILIDEYDAPVHAGYVNGFARQVLGFVRNFLSAGLKGNPHLFKAVITGILRIARESIFSGLNNLAVYTLLEPRFATAFGFTEAEVQELLARAGKRDALAEVQRWYNGYRFAGHLMYNPWSVLNFLHSQRDAQPYWLSTSDNALIKRLLERHAGRLHSAFEDLLAGRGIERTIHENVVLDELDRDEDALWSLLVFSGYLNAEEQPRPPGGIRTYYRLSIPNNEVRLLFTDTFRDWMKTRLYGHGGDLQAFIAALLGGDAAGLEEQLQALAMALLSYHDTGRMSPEALYHGFVLGLLAVLEPEYAVRSSRESGKGRPDVLIRPAQAGKPGVVLELKVARAGRKTLEQALSEGMEQLSAQDYAAELRATGADPVHAFAVAFDGKEVRVHSHP